jgi:hypothetical protein
MKNKVSIIYEHLRRSSVVKPIMRRSLLFALSCLFSAQSFAQLGGSYSFSFVNIDPSPRIAALGSSTMASLGRDISMAYFNPAMHDSSMNNMVQLNYHNYIADINNGYASYAKHFKGIGTFSGHIIFNEYGRFVRTDETGKVLGEFGANDYVFQIGYGQKYAKDERFTYGASIKFLYSNYERYVATAFALDGGVAFHNPEKLFHASLLVRNVGYNVIPYENERVNLPLDIQLGLSKKLAHNPLRLTIVAHNLQKFDISYVNVNKRNKNIDLATGQVKVDPIPLGDKIMRHFNFGAELVFSDNFQIRSGYNHQRRKELAPENAKGSAGFSWGVGIGIKKFTIDFAMVTYFPGITTSMFGVSKNLSDFKRVRPVNL